MKKEEVIIIGGGPCGLAAAIACQDKGLKPLVLEKDHIVSSIYKYPTHQTFFSTSEKLEIGDVAFVTEERKPHRNQALAYYRSVAERKNLRIHSHEKVLEVTKQTNGRFVLKTDKQTYEAAFVIIATGYYDSPNYMDIPGEDLPHVYHYFKEAHPYFKQNVVVIGGKNSAIDAALELEKAGAYVTALYRGDDYSASVKPWILPEYVSLVKNNKITLEFQAEVTQITSTDVNYTVLGKSKSVKADYVFAMTGYHPDHQFIKSMGVHVDDGTGRPEYNPDTFETNIDGLFIAGVIAAGNNANEIFIENGRWHGSGIASRIVDILANEHEGLVE
ncbi:YpdA family putative bacillithiol disulfide reductase [Alkalicoccobacillus plakortidis]|uniref:YpdA family putative bacillithiol disulfide reductase n=1 Tax=Alkalicoccobacillus plakortidis TaxID=444060 RepID=A0ABT0XEL1_9BACI|nr:YpdA family putative bacillithiol disulfide reductase [Alkalicoccobacillus plakortidis]MCM2674312.1 YpdA family putative bacillithiol disulfide reductase [Alkalicoccobacillus plakortidis]